MSPEGEASHSAGTSVHSLHTPQWPVADSVSPFIEVDLSASSTVGDYPIWGNNNNLINDDSNSNYHLLRAHRVSHCAESTFMY